MPGLLRSGTLTYLPLLNYTDLSPREAESLAATTQAHRYGIRALAPEAGEPEAGDPVVMRLDLTGLSEAEVWKDRLGSKCRNQVRKAQRSPIVTRSGTDRGLIDDFYRLMCRTMHFYGSPIHPRALFEAIARHLECRYYVTYLRGRPIAALVGIRDGNTVWVPWAASDRQSLDLCPNHQTYWQAISDSISSGADLFDFGRSPFRGPTWRFKVQWGAKAVPLQLLTSHPSDVYGKYRLAQVLWRRLPRFAADRLGPFLTRFLADY